MVTEVNDSTFGKEVFDYAGYVLVDFWAGWCAPCRQLAPVLERLAGTMGSQLKVVKVNVDQSSVVATQMGVKGIPALFLFKDGKQIDVRVGFVDYDTLEAWAKQRMASKTTE